jgi:hypothetical protein
MVSASLLRFLNWPLPVVFLSVALLAGCGGDPDASRETATVSGKVLLFGKPPSKGKITFDPRNPKRTDVEAVTAEIQADGSYSITAPLGLNRVFIDCEEIRTDPRLDQYRGGGELSYMVSKGTNQQDFKIGSQ